MTRKVRRRFYGVAGTVFLVSLGGLGLTGWLLGVYPNRAASGPGPSIAYELEPGTDLARLGWELHRRGVVDHPLFFTAYLRLMGAETRLRRGTVWLTPGATPRQLARQVALGFGPARTRVTFPEGFDRYDVAARAEANDVCSHEEFLEATTDPSLLESLGIPSASAEGYLFPDTYELESGGDCRNLVRRMVQTFQRRTSELFEASGGDSRLRKLRWGRQEVVVMASIVEKEAAVAEEQPLIAGVFLNRLTSTTFRPQRLQADPTVRYGCVAEPTVSDACRRYDGRITRAMLEDTRNPYNTYRHEGLPPGPICNPGLSAIRAVLSPAAHPYLYFVARGEGRHHFSETLEEHNAAVDRYLR